MALEVRKPPRQSERTALANLAQRRVVQVQCDSSYPTGGYDFNAREFATFEPEICLVPPYAGYMAEYDAATDKLLVYKAGTEIVNGTDLSSIYFYVIMEKLPGFTGHTLAPTALL